jgi:hypothetical protein
VLGKGLVGCIADQEVAEPEGILARELRLVRADELLANERHEASRQLGPVGSERLDGSAVEDPALDCTALEHVPLGHVELVEPGCEQCLDRWRHRELRASRIAHERHHLLDEERVALGRIRDLRPQLVVRGAKRVEQTVRLVTRQRLEQDGRRVQLSPAPALAPVEQLGARHAEHEEGRVPREVRDVLDQVEERLLGPMDVVEQAYDRPLVRPLLQQLPEAPRDRFGGCLLLALVEERPQRSSCRGVGRQFLEHSEHLDHRPVGDSLAVGKATTTDNRCIESVQELVREP